MKEDRSFILHIGTHESPHVQRQFDASPVADIRVEDLDPMHLEGYQMWQRQRERGWEPTFVCRAAHGGQQRYPYVRLRKACAAAGIAWPVDVHTLRHMAASHPLDGGVTTSDRQEVLGHSRLEKTARNAHTIRSRANGSVMKLSA